MEKKKHKKPTPKMRSSEADMQKFMRKTVNFKQDSIMAESICDSSHSLEDSSRFNSPEH
jgi:hypothetical protein